MPKLRVGAIGIGGMGGGHLRAALDNRGVKVCAVCDVNQDALDGITRRGVAKYTDWQELIENETLDLAMACLPHHLYAPVVTAALRRGLHVYKDKPFAKNLADAKRMISAAKRHRKRIFVGAQNKFSPSFLQAKKIVDSGKLGKVHFVRGAVHYYWQPIFKDAMRWRGRAEESGGIAIIDSGYHILDAVTAYHGIAATVFASTGSMRAAEHGDYDIDDKAALILNYSDGSLGSVTISFATVPGEFRVVLHGQKGTLDITSSQMKLFQGSALVKQLEVDNSKVNTLKAQFNHCMRALTRSEPSLCDMNRALGVQKIIDAAYESDRTGTVARVK